MAPITYQGALQPKKKAELQEIAQALRLSDAGTKDELQSRIKRHLDDNQQLADDPAFAGLFGRRRRSVPPVSRFTSASVDVEDVKQPSPRIRRTMLLDPINEVESTPQVDLRNVSFALKHAISPDGEEEDEQLGTSQQAAAPTSELVLSPVPRSATPTGFLGSPLVSRIGASPVRAILRDAQHDTEVMLNAVARTEATARQSARAALVQTRVFLSDSSRIYLLTAAFELLSLLFFTIPWKSQPIHITDTFTLSVYLPPLATFRTPAFWAVLFHWAIPTLVIPAAFSGLISFNAANPKLGGSPVPSPSPSSPAPRLLGNSNTELQLTSRPLPRTGTIKQSVYSPPPSTPNFTFDPLTAAIIRLATHIAYPYPPPALASLSSLEKGIPLSSSPLAPPAEGLLASMLNVHGADVLGVRWRVIDAAVGLAFAFAEAIQRGPLNGSRV